MTCSRDRKNGQHVEGCRGRRTKWRGGRSDIGQITGDVITQGLEGHLKECCFYSEWNVESLQGFEQGVM